MIRILAVTWLAFIVTLSASKSLGYGYWVWGNIEHFLGGNLQMHFVFAFVLSILAHLGSSARWQQCLILLVLILGCAIDEALQLFLPERSFNPQDVLASWAGLILAATPFLMRSGYKKGSSS
ncbi:VanZ family protein [Endozoicomonas ascidiicola]|uniref:VanZ family protein n=1 Tax=Endozoicomonas ascidiicola TaxID=1698521 RepID=UPI0012F80E14|nr:VanZ family protein [Endozoicomonas ascidiicola]